MSAGEKPSKGSELGIGSMLRYLELIRKGTWRQFDVAAKQLIPGLTHAFNLADRLAAQGVLEFRWQDRSWQLAPTTLVQAITDVPLFRFQARGIPHWRVFGATWETAASFFEAQGITPAREKVYIELPREKLYYDRCAISSQCMFPPAEQQSFAFVRRWDLEAAFMCLPKIAVAAQNWVGDAEEVDGAILRGAARTEKSDSEGGWQLRPFDNSSGFWRVDATPRRYYRVAGASGRMTVVRTPPDLGRWFDSNQPGIMRFDGASETMIIELNPKVMDIPTVYERWLVLWGCRRRVVSERPHIISFEGIDHNRATTLARLLSLREIA